MSIVLILYLIAFVSFLLAAISIPSKINLVALGLLAWVLVYVIPLIH